MTARSTLKILQYNIQKKGETVMAPLLEDPRVKEYDVIAIQEPWHNRFVHTSYNPGGGSFYLAFPAQAESRVCFYVNKRIDPNSWRTNYTSKDSGTLTLEKQAEGETKRISIHNVYNPPPGSYSARRTGSLEHARTMLGAGGTQILLGDFNLHHPLWAGLARPTQHAAADLLIELTEDNGMELMLPQGTLTWERGRSWSTIDLLFASEDLAAHLLHCKTRRDIDQSSDHLAISTEFFWEAEQGSERIVRNWKKADMGEVRERVKMLVGEADAAHVLREGVEAEALRIAEALIQAMQELVPLAKISPRMSPWWNEECAEAVKTARSLRKEGWRNDSSQRYNDYLKAVEHKGKVIKKAKKESFRATMSELTGNPDAIWKIARWAKDKSMLPRNPPQLPDLNSPDGIATTPEEKVETLRQKFFPTPPEPDMEDTIGFEYRPEWPTTQRIEDAEVQRVVRKLKSKKAPGPNEVPNEMIKSCEDILTPHLGRLFNACLEQGVHPKIYKRAKTIVLKKPGKKVGDYAEAKAYRPIALLDTIGKVFEKILALRLSALAEDRMLLPRAQMGARKGRSAQTALELLTEQVHTIWKQGTRKVATLLSLDQEQAFPNVRIGRLVHNLKVKGIPLYLIKWVESFMTDRATTIQIPGYESAAFTVSTGIPQGSPISPILFLFFNWELIEACSHPGRGVSGIGFVDDINVLVYGDSTEGNCQKLEKVHQDCESWAKRHGATFAPHKYELIHFSRTPKWFNMKASLNLNNIAVAPTASVRVLGVQLDTKLKWGAHIKKIEAKMTSQTRALTGLTKSTWGATFSNARHIYSAVISPSWAFGSAVWYHPEGGKEAKKKTTERLKVIQNKCLRVVAGAYKATHTMALEAETFIPPPDLFLKRLALLNRRRTKNTDGVKTIKDACEAISRRLRGRRGRSRRTIPTPVEERNRWADSILTEGEGDNAEAPEETRPNRREGARIKPKCKIKSYLEEKWKERWGKYQEEQEGRYREMPWTASEGVSRARLKGHEGLTRAESTVLTLLRTEKIGLAAFLKSQRVPGFESARCECGWPNQTAKHVVMFCAKYATHRRRLLADTGCSDYKELLRTPTATKKVTKWVIARNILPQFSWALERQEADEEESHAEQQDSDHEEEERGSEQLN